jgi:hypothetical protein
VLTCKLNNTNAYYEASTKTQIKDKAVQIHKKKTKRYNYTKKTKPTKRKQIY